MTLSAYTKTQTQSLVDFIKSASLSDADRNAADLLLARIDSERKRSPRDKHILKLAQCEATDELEVDDDAIISEGDDPGAFVQAWLWVSLPDDEEDDEGDEEDES